MKSPLRITKPIIQSMVILNERPEMQSAAQGLF